METSKPVSPPQQSSGAPLVSAVPLVSQPPEKRRCCSGQKWGALLLVLAFLAGLAGGTLAPLLSQMYQRHFQSPVAEKNLPSLEQDKLHVVAEENVVTDLVEKNSSGVVSIVITKDIPKMRSFSGSPFGGFPFFAPFAMPETTPGTEGGKQQVGSGSGFLVSADGLIVTNKHVVADEDASYTVIVKNKDEYEATVLARDPNNDIAILKIKGDNFPALELGNSDTIRVGETAIAIGNPLGEFANSVSKGIISGLERDLDASSGFGGDSERLSGIIQTDAAINPGNSGGPLFNLSGQVIGVNVAMAQGAENIGFALPINQVKNDVEQVRSTGKISVPYIGVRYLLLNKELQKQNNLPVDYGALVVRGESITDLAVVPGSPADKAGLVENDIILEIDKQKIDEEHPLSLLISQHAVGDELTLSVWHKGETKEVKLRLEERK